MKVVVRGTVDRCGCPECGNTWGRESAGPWRSRCPSCGWKSGESKVAREVASGLSCYCGSDEFFELESGLGRGPGFECVDCATRFQGALVAEASPRYAVGKRADVLSCLDCWSSRALGGSGRCRAHATTRAS